MPGSAFPDDAIAIIGVACRLPGGINSVDQLWAALIDGQDLVTTVPADRFDAAQVTDRSGQRPGKTYTDAGGFLDDVAGFDTGFFDVISPREASRVDPQQRLLLEMAVEACDDAGVDPGSLAGSPTAVFVGASSRDYGDLQTSDPRSMDSHTMTGTANTNAANRLSHVFDLHGPSITMDTACSSGLTAVHSACEHLRSAGGGTAARMAIAGGINLILNPYLYVGFSAASMLSPTGRCRPFSADADGYVRSEGGGVVLLKRLSDAVAAGDRIHAVIVATGAGSDGRTAGLSLPNAEAQETLLHEVYGDAGVDPDDVAYLEAHGTGTAAGDPIESRALGRALGQRRTSGALPVGSVKSNLGHLEAGSGIAGLLKAMLVLRHRRIPPLLHAERLNPDIDFDALGLEPVTAPRELADTDGSVVGVNSFGFGGSNAHVALRPPPSQAPAPAARAGARTARGTAVPVLVSGRSEAALHDAALAMAGRLEGADEDELYDIAYTACRRRGAYERRAAVVASDPAQAASALRGLMSEPKPPAGTASSRGTATGKVALVFCGNGPQWTGMGVELLASEPAFESAVREVDSLFKPRVGWSVIDELKASPEASRMHQTEVGQPALFAVQVGLAALLEHYGVRPAAVAGHSVGEIAAAYVAGALDLSSAVMVLAERCTAQARTAGQGGMAALGLGAQDAEQALARFDGRVELAAVNSARDVTVAGDVDALEELGEELSAAGTFFRLLDVDIPFHSRFMEPLAEPLLAALSEPRLSATRVPFISTVTGGALEGTELDGDYWWREIRQPVLFAPAVQTLLELGCEVFVDVGPHPVLSTYLRRLTAGDKPTAVVPTLVREQDAAVAMRTTVAGLVAGGADLDWRTLFPEPGRVVDLPSYQWQRERHWNGEPSWWSRGSGGGATEHPLLGERAPVLQPTWHQVVDTGRVQWLADHRLDDVVVMPGAAFVEMALAAGQLVHDHPVEVTGLDIDRALVLPPGDDAMEVRKQVSLSQDGVVHIASHIGDDERWQEHARGRVRRLLAEAPDAIDIDAARARMTHHQDRDSHYAAIASAGVGYGPSFRVLAELHVGDGETIASYDVSELLDDGYGVHPCLLDGALQAGLPLLPAGSRFLPARMDAVRMWRRPEPTGVIHLRAREAGARPRCDITIADHDGRVAVEIEGCQLRRFDPASAGPVRSYTTVLRASAGSPSAAASPITSSVAEMRSSSSAQRARLAAGWDAERYRESVRQFKRYTAHFAAQGFADLGAGRGPGAEAFGVDDLIAAGVQPGYEPLLDALAGMAHAEGLLKRCDDGERRKWKLTGEPRPTECLAQMVTDFPENSAETVVNGRCGLHLSEILLGQRDPLEILFADADRQFVERIYSDSPVIRLLNGYARTLVDAIVREWPADRPLRVLEVGAGGGGLTSALLPALPPERTHYVFTDVSQSFFPRAQQRFASFDFVEYSVFDIDSHAEDQGFADASFDLVVAGNVLHASRDLRGSLERVARLLCDGGHLLAMESHDIEILAPCFGLLDSFWDYSDTSLRPSSPLVAASGWPAILTGSGFDEVAQVGDEQQTTGGDYSVLLASRQARSQPSQHFAPSPDHNGHRELGDDAQWIVASRQPDDVLARALHTSLRSKGAHVGEPVRAQASTDAWRETLAANGVARNVVLIVGAGGPEADDPCLDDAEYVVEHAAVIRSIAAACAELTDDSEITFWLIATHPTGALPAPEAPAAPRDAGIWGLARSVANEHPRIRFKRISLAAHDASADAERLTGELLRDDGDIEDEVVLTGHGRFVARVMELESTAVVTPPGAADTAGRPYRLEVRKPGLSHQLAWTPAQPSEPGPSEVVIEVRAAGMNYRDVMVSVGLIPPESQGETATGHRLGQECAGVVTAVGAEVTEFAPGDRVLALAHLSIASHAVVPADQVGHMPDDMSFAAAATMPAVFFTAHYGLRFLARLQPGETVLVHGGAGGVGLAALQVARACGAEVIATAGTPAKRDLLRLLGVEHILDSRSLVFAERVKQITHGRGVDVVLNSLAGEAIDRALEVLAPGGRFVELGKRDILADTPLSMRRFEKNLSLFTLDAHTSFTHQPHLARRQWAEVGAAIADGTYVPLLHQTYPASQVRDAMSALQHSRHVGKLVVTFEQPPQLEGVPERLQLDPAGTYLVTGGLGGFGAATAHWLADHGAGALALVSRRGDEAPEGAALIGALAERGVTATACRADAADVDQMRDVIAAIDAGGHPLRGVVHAAMVLDDAPLTEMGEMTDDRIRAVVLPKIRGAVVLDTLTREHELDLFVMYSSVAALVGNPAQSAYAAGNLFLEALAQMRRARGRPGVAVAWGSIGDAGYVAREQIVDTMATVGLMPVQAQEALDALGELMSRGVAVADVGRFDWARLAHYLPSIDVPRFGPVLPEHTDADGESREDIRDRLATGTDEEAHGLLTKAITKLVANVLETSVERVDVNRRLDLLGMDSLMAAELVTTMNRTLGCDIPVVEVTSSTGIADLAHRVLIHTR